MDRKPARKFDINKYEEYVQKYKYLTIKRNKTILHTELRKPEFNLPDARWLVKHCPDKNVKQFSDFVSWCGFFSRNTITKEKAINLIYKMQKQLNRPLMYDDFRGTGCYKVPIIYINKYWGTMNKMKEDLGLEVIQENMIDKKLSKSKFVEQINLLCKIAESENRKFITTYNINNCKDVLDINTLRKYSKLYFNKSLSDYIKSLGFAMGMKGSGLNFKFDDGEQVSSQFEYMFSMYLKDYGLKYNTDYFRNVKYNDFIPNYKGNMNCDYVIKYKNKTIYIEIAGIIEAYKTWYYNNKIITRSKSKENYRLKLKQKEKMLKENNLIYFILFPCDLTRDNFMQIINDSSLDLKHRIENFMKNNIDWVKVKNVGELKYKSNKYNNRGKLIINYGEGG
ncbi:hypothetical protein KQI61_07855 [Anaerocolumna aminovalerica]|uniref:hypothetical protein n=1 Tax=Anaerocolumna aminovalerica TaxID=1527 RepID=UPI001C0F15C1|nr:hypothetical protein [Anaerocolumna aminovalerica]MBU5332111.1 hypothetical protein [Anaerocolumna aminovalerica]